MSWAGDVRARYDWLSNSYRFASEREAEAFIKQLKAQWVPANFVHTTRVIWSKDPVNARWVHDKQDVIRLDVTAVNDAPAVTVEEDNEPPPHHLMDETAYRSRHKLPRRRLTRDMWEQLRAFRDQSRWSDKEGSVLLSETVRRDIRHLIAHGGEGRLKLSRGLFDFFKDAHEGRAPDSILDFTQWMVTPEGRACRAIFRTSIIMWRDYKEAERAEWRERARDRLAKYWASFDKKAS